MWEYEVADKLVEKFGIDTVNEVSKTQIREQLVAEVEWECERMKNNGRKITKVAKREAQETVAERVNKWMSQGYGDTVTAKAIATYRTPYLFFQLLANTVKK